MKFGIVYGGTSTERLASAKNANHINEILAKSGLDTCMLNYDDELPDKLKAADIEFVFLCVQGKGHGDGTLQALLDFMHIPYTGSGMTAAALINDKILCKKLFEYHNHPTPPWMILNKTDYLAGNYDISSIGYPFVAKAPSQGGSFGIELIRSEQELINIASVYQYDDPILLEQYVPGKFYTVGVLEHDGKFIALPCVEGLDYRDTKDELTLFTGSYGAKSAELPDILLHELLDTAIAIFRETGAHDYARIDYIVDNNKSKFNTLEINAVPGLKPESLLPLEAALMGIEYEELITGILNNAMRRYGICSVT